jgi:hypothetical protein
VYVFSETEEVSGSGENVSNGEVQDLKLLTKHYEGDKTKDDAVGVTRGSGGGGG